MIMAVLWWDDAKMATRMMVPVNLPCDAGGGVQETYSYYSLPFCSPGDSVQDFNKKKASGLFNFGEILAGNRLRNSGIDIKFKGEVQWYGMSLVCPPSLEIRASLSISCVAIRNPCSCHDLLCSWPTVVIIHRFLYDSLLSCRTWSLCVDPF